MMATRSDDHDNDHDDATPRTVIPIREDENTTFSSSSSSSSSGGASDGSGGRLPAAATTPIQQSTLTVWGYIGCDDDVGPSSTMTTMEEDGDGQGHRWTTTMMKMTAMDEGDNGQWTTMMAMTMEDDNKMMMMMNK
jgi:hypothetical protein